LFSYLAEGAGLHHLGEEDEVVGTGHIDQLLERMLFIISIYREKGTG
jgi:hypothetical protein